MVRCWLKFFAMVMFGVVLCTSVFAQSEIPSDLRISLERSGCFGRCPNYKVTISADGTVSFVRNSFLPSAFSRDGETGPLAKEQLTREKLQLLMAEFESVNFNFLNGRYVDRGDPDCPQWVTDGLIVTTSITVNGKKKTVKHYSGCEGSQVLVELNRLENFIDETVDTARLLAKPR